MKMLDLFFDFYVAKSSLTKESRTSFEQAFVPLLERVCEQEQVISLRDYHAENLMVLGDGAPPVALGILDFQDAFICHSAYDVVSLLQDARRDLDQASTETLLNEFIQQSPREREDFLLAYHVLGLQRNMRILGISVVLRERRENQVICVLKNGSNHICVITRAGVTCAHSPKP